MTSCSCLGTASVPRSRRRPSTRSSRCSRSSSSTSRRCVLSVCTPERQAMRWYFFVNRYGCFWYHHPGMAGPWSRAEQGTDMYIYLLFSSLVASEPPDRRLCCSAAALLKLLRVQTTAVALFDSSTSSMHLRFTQGRWSLGLQKYTVNGSGIFPAAAVRLCFSSP